VNDKVLFISRHLDAAHYAAVIFDRNDNCFYHALFEGRQFGGAFGYALKDKGRAVSVDMVRKLADASEDGNACKYTGMTEDNWRGLVE